MPWSLAKAAYAYDRGVTGKGVTIAVIDSGINRSPRPNLQVASLRTALGSNRSVARCGTCAPETVAAISDRRQARVMAPKSRRSRPQPRATASGPQGCGAGRYDPRFEGFNGPGSSNGLTRQQAPRRFQRAKVLAECRVDRSSHPVCGRDHGAFVTVMSLNGFATGSSDREQTSAIAMDAVRAADRLVRRIGVRTRRARTASAGQYRPEPRRCGSREQGLVPVRDRVGPERQPAARRERQSGRSSRTACLQLRGTTFSSSTRTVATSGRDRATASRRPPSVGRRRC